MRAGVLHTAQRYLLPQLTLHHLQICLRDLAVSISV
jgi:hypothetical protein